MNDRAHVTFLKKITSPHCLSRGRGGGLRWSTVCKPLHGESEKRLGLESLLALSWHLRGQTRCQAFSDTKIRDAIWVRVPDPTGTGTGTIFYSRVAPIPDPKSRRVRDEYFFSPTGNPTGIRYFTTAIILSYEQVKICSFCYINYDLF
jgi:hypothetical protein